VDRLLMSPEEAAELLRVGRSTVYDLMRSRRLVSIKIGRRRLVPAAAVTAYIDGLVAEGAA
jgi:excisionase family DNA binding protein